MLEVMSGTLIDKTNNNLSNLSCAHSTMGQKTDPGKENMMDVTEADVSVISFDLQNNSSKDMSESYDSEKILEDNISKQTLEVNVSQETSESNVSESTNLNCNNNYNSTNISSVKNVKNKFKSNKERKLLYFLEKNNVTEKELNLKLKHLRRQTKDKRKPNSVLSLKLNRYYFKSNKPKWSNRITTKKKTELINSYLTPTSKLNESLESSKESKNESSGSNSLDELKINTNSEIKSDSVNKIISDFRSDDDIRNKIKKQLELLRQNKKQIIKPIESKPEILKSPEKITVNFNSIITPESDINIKPIPANLDDVLLSKGDGGLSIVSVVGGYISDEELNQEDQYSQEAANDTEETKKETTQEYLSQISRGGSITDILLKRELNSNLSDTFLIKLTKTNDITKIKGWRSKQFTAINSPEITNSEDMSSIIENQENIEDISPEKKDTEYNQVINSIENPLPSTSAGYIEPETKNSCHIPVKADNILKQGENTDIEKNTKSAFVSDMLDTFLTNHAALNISYEVPKLVAEEAISKPISEMPVGNTQYLSIANNSTSLKKKTTGNKVFKPKTLAEKRRMLEQDRQKQLLHDMETNESIYLKQLEYCEKRNKNEVAKDVRENILIKDAPVSRHCWNLATRLDEDARQFVLVNGNKIRILGSAGGNDIIAPNEIIRSRTRNQNRTKSKVYYKPGPLSRKHKLMKCKENSENWECHILNMPKVKLVVCPERGKRLPILAEQYLTLCRGETGFISDELAKFAVSAIRSEEYVKTNFEFNVPYRNGQDKLLVRKQIFQNTSHNRMKKKMKESVSTVPVIKKEFSDVDVEECIKDMMSKMLNCIGNQELDKIIIKDDPDLENFAEKIEKSQNRPPSPIDPRVQAIIKKSNARRSKATLELRRLNVQVIEVDVKEDEIEPEVCTKEFCKLGCVCKSLRGATSLVSEHCGRETCMLECSCTFTNTQRGHHAITLPAGTDLLSASTVVRLQDEVKRNLAKEEREFTQTVIKANNQTIMVGGGIRERQKRISKVPKKYSNYVQKTKNFSYEKMISGGLLEEDEDFEVQISKFAIQKAKEEAAKKAAQRNIIEVKKPVPIWNKANKKADKKIFQSNHECHVILTKFKLENVVPWCMVHNLYKCHCDGKATSELIPTKPKEPQITTSDTINNNECIPYAPRLPSRFTVSDLTDKCCARTRGLAAYFYKARKKPQELKARNERIRKQEILKNVNFEAMKSEVSIDEGSKNNFIEVTESQMTSNNNKIKRIDHNSANEQDLGVLKQNKNIVEDTLKQKTSPKPCHVVSAASFIDYERSFLGILTPSSEWLEKFHKMLNLNLNTVIRQIRLLEWATLVKRFKKGTLQLWFNNKKYNNIILTEDRKRPSRSHMNIKLFENTQLAHFRVPEIITSLFKGKLPGVATNDTETYVILVYNGISWEARGTIVLNDTSEMCRQRLGHKPTPSNILDPILQCEMNKQQSKLVSLSPNQNLVIRSTPAMSVEVVNRETSVTTPTARTIDRSGLEITKIPVAKENVENSVKQNTSLEKRKDSHILAPLPTGFGLNRWFMLILKNDFSVLRISFSNFHIKYTHLITAIQTARNNQKTVRIRSQDKNIENPNNFGVYAVPGFSEKIFFGPYNNDIDHGLETFRYVNGKLVNTKIYNKMRGNVEKNTTGIWYFHISTVQNNLLLEPQKDNTSSGSDCSTEMTSAEKAVRPQIEFVDLTENDSDSETSVRENTATQNIDPLFNVLSADFTKKVSGDITIEPVFDNVSISSKSTEKKQTDIVILPVNDDNAKLTTLASSDTTSSAKENGCKDDRKRKSLTDLLQEPPKKQPMLIDSINLDDDEAPPKLEHFNSQKGQNVDTVKQMPALCRINNAQNLNNESFKKRNVIYVITNIPGIGYFEILLSEKKCMQLNINGKATMFQTINMAITWLHQLFRKHIYFIPKSLKVKFSILESTEVPEMSKFNENFLNGNHMMCEKGIFDLIRMNTDNMDNLGFSEHDTSTLLAHKCELLISRNIKTLGNYLVGPEEASKLDQARILQIAPKKIKVMETREAYLQEQKAKLQYHRSELLAKVNILLKDAPDTLKTYTWNKINSIIPMNQEPNVSKNMLSSTAPSTPLPAGKICKIVDGKVLVLDTPPENKIPIRSLTNFKKQQNVQSFPIKIVNSLQTSADKSTQPFEMLVPISGLKTPVTVVGVPTSQQSTTAVLWSNFVKSSETHKVVDLTND